MTRSTSSRPRRTCRGTRSTSATRATGRGRNRGGSPTPTRSCCGSGLLSALGPLRRPAPETPTPDVPRNALTRRRKLMNGIAGQRFASCVPRRVPGAFCTRFPVLKETLSTWLRRTGEAAGTPRRRPPPRRPRCHGPARGDHARSPGARPRTDAAILAPRAATSTTTSPRPQAPVARLAPFLGPAPLPAPRSR